MQKNLYAEKYFLKFSKNISTCAAIRHTTPLPLQKIFTTKNFQRFFDMLKYAKIKE